ALEDRLRELIYADFLRSGTDLGTEAELSGKQQYRLDVFAAQKEMKRGNLVVRADATVTSGTGHVMRCLALAQAWQDAGGQAIFAMAEGTLAVAERLRNESFEVERPGVQVGSAADAEKTSQLALQRGATWVVVDGYKFNAEYHASLKSHGLKVLLID